MSSAIWDRANQIIPGGNHLFSKTPNRYCPGRWPAYYKAAHGITVTTPDGTAYKDFSIMAAGNSILGYADPDVDAAVHAAIYDGNVSTLNCPEEVELAEILLSQNPKMDMVRFGRSGNDACQIALRIAREYSGKQRFAICGYHGWQIGHPPQLDPDCTPFDYGDVENLDSIITPEIGAVIMEPIRSKPVDIPFLRAVRERTEALDIPMIIDEIMVGYRLNMGGYHQTVGIQPDIALYSKALGNGHAISAVVGKREVMNAALNTFISSMFWSERTGYAAGIATMEKMRRVRAQEQINLTGALGKLTWSNAAEEAGIGIEISGLDPLGTFTFNDDPDRVLMTTYTQEMLKRGYLASGQFYVSTCHTLKEMDAYSANVHEVFADIASGKAKLEGNPCIAGFKRIV